MPRQLRKVQAFPEMPRDFRKCLISAIPCDIYNIPNSILERSRESSGRGSQLRCRSAGHGRDEEEGRGEEERGGRQKMKKVIPEKKQKHLSSLVLIPEY